MKNDTLEPITKDQLDHARGGEGIRPGQPQEPQQPGLPGGLPRLPGSGPKRPCHVCGLG
jgi:hypothetical protein